MPRYPHTNSPHRYPYISLEDQLREFDMTKWKHFPLVIDLLILIAFSVDGVLILLRENSCWSPLWRKGLSWLIWWTSWILSHFSAFISIKFIAWLIWDCWNAAGSKLKAINPKGGGKTRCPLRLSAIKIDSENEVSPAIMNKTRTTDLFAWINSTTKRE